MSPNKTMKRTLRFSTYPTVLTTIVLSSSLPSTALATCPPVGSDCSATYFDTDCGRAEWNLYAADALWACNSAVNAAFDAEEATPGAITKLSALPRQVCDYAGNCTTQTASTTQVTAIDEIAPVRDERNFRDLSSETVAVRAYEAALYESDGPAVESCREFAFHAWQDWAEYHDAAIQESWSSRQYFDEAYGPNFNIAATSTSTPGNPKVLVAKDRDLVLLPDIGFEERWINAVEAWDRVSQRPEKSPKKVLPSIDWHYQQGQYAIAQGWSFSALDDLWERQKELLAAISAYHLAEKAKMDAIMEDLVRFGNTPVQAWDYLDLEFGLTNPGLESGTPARCRYNELVKLAGETSSSGRRQAVVDQALLGAGSGPREPSRPANGGDLRDLEDGFDREIILGQPGDFGNPLFDPYYNTGGALPQRPDQYLLDYGHEPFPTGDELCDPLDELIFKPLSPHDFNFNPLQHRFQQANIAKTFAQQRATVYYDDVERFCPKGATTQTPCDWSPSSFMETVANTFDEAVNVYEANCLARTGDILDTFPGGPTCPYPLPDSPPSHSLRTFFSGYDCNLMLKFLDPGHPSYVAPSSPPPPNALSDFNDFWDKAYTSNVSTFRELYADMDQYALIKQWVLEEGVGRMARKVADQMHLERQGRTTFDRSFADARSRSVGPGGASTSASYSSGYQFPAVVGGNLQEAFSKRVGSSKASFKNNSSLGPVGDDIVDFSGDIGADGNTGDYSKSTTTQTMGLSTSSDSSTIMPFTFSTKNVQPKKKFSFLTVFGLPNQAKIASLGPISLYAEFDIVAYAKAAVNIKGIEGIPVALTNGVRESDLEFSVSVGIEGFIGLAIDIVLVRAGIQAGILFVDVGFVFTHNARSSLREFSSIAEADSLLPDLNSFGQCTHPPTGSVCQGLNMFKRGGPTAAVINNRNGWSERFEMKALQFFVRVYARIGVPPLAVTFEKDLARSKGLKTEVSLRSEESEVDLLAMVACDDALDVIPAGWDRSTCLIEEAFPSGP
ncbi:MAG: hypothetical protein AAF627_15575 [Myxococcota bacterium]